MLPLARRSHAAHGWCMNPSWNYRILFHIPLYWLFVCFLLILSVYPCNLDPFWPLPVNNMDVYFGLRVKHKSRWKSPGSSHPPTRIQVSRKGMAGSRWFSPTFVNIPKLFVDSGCIDCGINFFHFDFSIFSIPHLSVDSACVLGSPMFARFSSGNFSPNFRSTFPLPFPLPLPPIGFQDVTSWKNFSILGGHSIYIHIYITVQMQIIWTCMQSSKN